jgi:hypothetical protein
VKEFEDTCTAARILGVQFSGTQIYPDHRNSAHRATPESGNLSCFGNRDRPSLASNNSSGANSPFSTSRSFASSASSDGHQPRLTDEERSSAIRSTIDKFCQDLASGSTAPFTSQVRLSDATQSLVNGVCSDLQSHLFSEEGKKWRRRSNLHLGRSRRVVA